MHREKDLLIAKKFCASRKRFVESENDLSIMKKICRLGFNLFLCFALMGFCRKSVKNKKKYVHAARSMPSSGVGEFFYDFYKISLFATHS